jgi:hypothetical protein
MLTARVSDLGTNILALTLTLHLDRESTFDTPKFD